MEIPAFDGWNIPLVVEHRDEMYGRCDGSSFYPWKSLPSMDGGYSPVECNRYYIPLIHYRVVHKLNRDSHNICTSAVR